MRFDRFGVTFDYPDAWAIEIDADTGDEPAVTVVTPAGGFWSVSSYARAEDAAPFAEAVREQMCAEYDDIDVEPADDEIAGERLPGYDFNFTCLDLTNTAAVRTLSAGSRTHVVFCQAEDREWDRVAEVFAAMTTSLVRNAAERGRA